MRSFSGEKRGGGDSLPPRLKLLAALLWLAAPALISSTPATAEPATRSTMSVEGRFLIDPNGERLVLRGVNAMIVYWDKHGELSYPEIAKTGANVCRIFWTTTDEATAADLDATLQNCWDNGMIPMIALWDATGKWHKLDECIAYWQRPEVVEVLRRHEQYLLLNIANEAGDKEVSHEAFREKYRDAIQSLRQLELRMPLVIDAAGWGRDEAYLLDNADYLLEQDPLRNLIFSWHPWDTEQPRARYKEAIDASIEREICFIIGEFSRVGVAYEKPIDYSFILDYTQEHSIGWLVWVWNCCGGKIDGHSLTTDSHYGNWANDGWGEELVLEHPNGLSETARRTAFLRRGD